MTMITITMVMMMMMMAMMFDGCRCKKKKKLLCRGERGDGVEVCGTSAIEVPLMYNFVFFKKVILVTDVSFRICVWLR